MMAIMLAGKLLGVLRDRLHGVMLGADTAEGIAFMQASLLPRTFLDIMFASAFSASFIPVFNSYLETKDKKAAFDLAALFISVVLALTAAFTVLCVIFAEPVYALFLGGDALPAETAALGVKLLRVMFPLMILSGLAFTLTGVLQSLGQFNIPAAMSVASNAVIILYYYFFLERFGVYGLCAAFLVGWALQAAIQIPFLVKRKFKFKFNFNLKDPGLKKIAALMLPAAAASWAGPVNLLVNGKAVNMTGGPFDYNAIQYANNLYAIASGVFVLAVANLVFPKFSRQAAANDAKGLSETLNETLRGLVLFLVPLSAGLIALARPIVKLVNEYGLFGEDATAVTSRALFWFSFGIVGYGLQIVLSRACYALRDGRTPVIASAVAIAINAAISFSLTPFIGIAGPTVASSVSITAAGTILLASLYKKGYINFSKVSFYLLLKIILLCAAMLAVVLPCRNFFAASLSDTVTNRVINAAVPALAGAFVYVIGALLLKIKLPFAGAAQTFKG